MDNQAITPIQELAREVETYVLVGPPGTGKTTEQTRLITDAQDRGWMPLVASLTRTAARELAGRELPIAPERIGTLHAHAYRALGGPTIAESKLGEWNAWVTEHRLGDAWAISTGYGKKPRLDDPNDAGSSGEEDERTEGLRWLETAGILRAKMVPTDRWPSVALQAFHRQWCAWKASTGYLDFTDLIQECLEREIAPAVEFDAFYLDEAQDSSRLEMSLALQWARRARAMVVSGDPRQNVYEWRGSEPEVLYELIRASRKTRVLEQSYRVPVAVHAEAMSWVAQLNDGLEANYLPRPEQGRCEYGGTRLRHPEEIIDQVEQDIAEGRTVMLLTTCSYLLDPLIHELRDRGLPFYNPYRTHNGRWNPLHAAYKTTSSAGRLVAFSRVNEAVWNGSSRLWTGDEIRAWSEPLAAEVFCRGAKSELKALRDETEISPDWLADRVARPEDLEKMFSGDLWWYEQHVLPGQAAKFRYPFQVAAAQGVRTLAEEPKIVTGTIHSVKGGERDRVYLWPDLSPAGFEEWTNPATRDRLVRLLYVGMTRARESLVLGAPSSSRAVTW